MNGVYAPPQPALFGVEGELVLVRVSVEPRHLEDLLEALATLDFPVNPELEHKPGRVDVQFPAYASHISEVKKTLAKNGFDNHNLRVHGVLVSPATVASDR